MEYNLVMPNTFRLPFPNCLHRLSGRCNGSAREVWCTISGPIRFELVGKKRHCDESGTMEPGLRDVGSCNGPNRDVRLCRFGEGFGRRRRAAGATTGMLLLVSR